MVCFYINCILRFSNCWIQLQGSRNAAEDGPSSSATAAADGDYLDDIDDDDELDMDELEELEASLSKTSILIKETGAEA